jgi:hypothetical protein
VLPYRRAGPTYTHTYTQSSMLHQTKQCTCCLATPRCRGPKQICTHTHTHTPHTHTTHTRTHTALDTSPPFCALMYPLLFCTPLQPAMNPKSVGTAILLRALSHPTKSRHCRTPLHPAMNTKSVGTVILLRALSHPTIKSRPRHTPRVVGTFILPCPQKV